MFRKKSRDNTSARRPITQQSGSSAPVVRYYRPETVSGSKKNSNQLENSRIEPSQSTSMFKRVGSIIWRWGVLLLIIGFLMINTTLSEVAIKAPDSSYLYQSQEVYEAELNKLLRSSLSSQSKLLLQSSRFESDIREEFPEVQEVTAVIPLAGRTLQIGLEFAEPLMRLQMPNNEQGIISRNGVLVFSDSASVINSKYSSLPSLSVPLLLFEQKEQVLTVDEANLLALLVDEFDGSDESRPKVSTVEFDVKKREIRVRFSVVNYYAKLTPEREARAQIGALVALLEEQEDRGAVPAEYVDVRVEGRVFIK